uniref:MIT domain-containing protein n=1 Tax=Clastoptera arizonana TaxID=38151 RepID=A0A1B6CBU2_9HEMI
MNRDNTDLEKAGSDLIKKGIVLDQNHQYEEALMCFHNGIQMLLTYTKGLVDSVKKAHYMNTIEKYFTKAETLKKLCEQEKHLQMFHEQICIQENSTKNSYKTLFRKYLNSDVSVVHIKDPYIRVFHQVVFVMFKKIATSK